MMAKKKDDDLTPEEEAEIVEKERVKQASTGPNTLKAAVREGGTIYVPGNQEQADALVEILEPNACKRLLDNGVVTGKGFAAKAAKAEDLSGPTKSRSTRKARDEAAAKAEAEKKAGQSSEGKTGATPWSKSDAGKKDE